VEYTGIDYLGLVAAAGQAAAAGQLRLSSLGSGDSGGEQQQ
jgi:hypothetical protein